MPSRTTPWSIAAPAGVQVGLRRTADGGHVGEIPPLAAGSHRVTLSGGRAVEPAEDVFVVADDREP